MRKSFYNKLVIYLNIEAHGNTNYNTNYWIFIDINQL